jgi:hypothetical protein
MNVSNRYLRNEDIAATKTNIFSLSADIKQKATNLYYSLFSQFRGSLILYFCKKSQCRISFLSFKALG